MTPEERLRSRWAVQPGSVSESVSFGRPDAEPRHERRPASEIIREIRERPGNTEQPTRISDRLPAVPPAHVARDREAAAVEPRATRATLHNEANRVRPELGENRELRAASGGSSSGLVMAGFGGVLLIVLGGLIGGSLDFLFAERLGVVVAIGLTLAAALAALITRKRDLISIMVAPPIVYAVIAAMVLLVSTRQIQVTTIADTAIRGFPAMALATGVAALIGGVRLLTSRVGERR